MMAPWSIALICLAPLLVTLLVAWSGCIMVHGWPSRDRSLEAEKEAITYLSRAMRAAIEEKPCPGSRLRKLEAIEKVLMPSNDFALWEQRTVDLIYDWGEADQADDPFDQALAELFELSRVNAYSSFSKARSVEQYERVRECLARLGIEAKPATDLTIGRLQADA